MARLFGPIVLAACLLTPSEAAASPFQATLGLRVGNLGSVSFTASGTGTSNPLLVTLPPAILSGTESTALPAAAPPVTALRVRLANAGGGFAGDPLAGPLAMLGTAFVRGNLGAGPTTLVAIPLFETRHGATSGVSSAGLGVGGTIYRTGPYAPYAYLRVYNQAWTAGHAVVSMIPYYYVYHIPFGAMVSLNSTYTYSTYAFYHGSDARTPGGLGQVTLVSPTRVVSTLTGSRVVLVTLGTLTLNFVPEPGTAFLLGVGVAALGALGARRLRS